MNGCALCLLCQLQQEVKAKLARELEGIRKKHGVIRQLSAERGIFGHEHEELDATHRLVIRG